jgi:DNA polymerase-4
LHTLTIAHIDCDAFFAAIEKRDNPELDGKPVIIGGGKRGVVATCCYNARTYGVRSAMPMFQALRLCPKAIIIPPNMKKYTDVGHKLRDLMHNLTPLVQPISIDEAFLDLSGTQRVHRSSPAVTLAKFSKLIEDELGITASVGLSYNKFLAKICSDLEKPKGFSVIGENEATSFLGLQPVSMIWGVGSALERKLRKDGINKISQLQHFEKTELMKRYGVMGARLYHFSRGEDIRAVNTKSVRKSISSETTFEHDIINHDTLTSYLWTQAEIVSKALKEKNFAGLTVMLKLKATRHQTITRSLQLNDPTQMAHVLFSAAETLLGKIKKGPAYRLIGLGISTLSDTNQADQPDLIDTKANKKTKVEKALDKVKSKYGDGSITHGRTHGRTYGRTYGRTNGPADDKGLKPTKK